jgi:methylmalonyl-CoA/ethylmalonyl-CoA epimerase
MAIKLDHIGLVLQKISDIAEIFRALGFREMANPESDPIQKVAASFVPVGEGQDVYIELLEPVEERSSVTEFFKERGGGLHHICFEVDDIEEITDRVRERGLSL